MEHHQCALRHIGRQAVIISQLQSGILEPDWLARLRNPGIVPCGDETQSGPVLTHTVTLKLHGPGPTHFHHNDEPPTR